MEFTDFEFSVFLDEVTEKLEALSENILVLEREPENEEAVKEMFRAAHTIKGSSGIMGFQKMTELTHEMESVLDKIRNRSINIDTNIINILLECIDCLKILQEEIINKEDNYSTEDILSNLRSIYDVQVEPQSLHQDYNSCEPDLDDIEITLVADAKNRGFNPLWIKVSLDLECQMKGIRAYLVFHNLQDFGEIIKSSPSVEEIQDGNFEKEFFLLLLSNESEVKVKTSLEAISEIDLIEIKKISLGNEQGQKKEQESGQTKESLEAKQGVQESENINLNKPSYDFMGKGGALEKRLNQTVRVNVEKLDKLMDLVGELVIDRGRLTQVTNDLSLKIGTDDLLENLDEITSHLAQVANELQDEIMKARMLPVDQVFNRFPRMVRDLAQKLGKDIDFNLFGGDTELDRTVIEAIGDPLIHLIRNAIDHGIETPELRTKAGKASKGTINLSARYQENYVMITIEDDGKGINREQLKTKAIEKCLLSAEEAKLLSHQEALNIIFYPGFSTARAVSDVSGRGVGMDIVRSHIQSINGTIEIDSQLGFGTTFYIKLPLTLAIIQALLVEVQQQVYSFPLANVLEIIKLNQSDVKFIQEQEVMVLRGEILPLFPLAELFAIAESGSYRDITNLFVVVAGVGEKRIGIIVDRLLGEQEIVIKTLGSYLGEVSGISGATILGDGKVALIVDIRSLIAEINGKERKLRAV